MIFTARFNGKPRLDEQPIVVRVAEIPSQQY